MGCSNLAKGSHQANKSGKGAFGGKGGAAGSDKGKGGSGNFLGDVKVSNIAKFAKQTAQNSALLHPLGIVQLLLLKATERLEKLIAISPLFWLRALV